MVRACLVDVYDTIVNSRFESRLRDVAAFAGVDADVWLAGESAAKVPVQVMDDTGVSAPPPATCGANGTLISPNIASNAHLPLLAGTNLRINAGFLLALACAAGVWWLMSRSTLGFEFRTVGANPNAARSSGMSVTQTMKTWSVCETIISVMGLALAVGMSYVV